MTRESRNLEAAQRICLNGGSSAPLHAGRAARHVPAKYSSTILCVYPSPTEQSHSRESVEDYQPGDANLEASGLAVPSCNAISVFLAGRDTSLIGVMSEISAEDITSLEAVRGSGRLARDLGPAVREDPRRQVAESPYSFSSARLFVVPTSSRNAYASNNAYAFSCLKTKVGVLSCDDVRALARVFGKEASGATAIGLRSKDLTEVTICRIGITFLIDECD